MIRRILIVGGASGIGLSIAVELASRPNVEKVYVVDKALFPEEYSHAKIVPYCFDLTNDDYSIFNQFEDVNALMVTAGFGKLALFKEVSDSYITDSFKVNTIPVLRLVKHFYHKLEGAEDFHCGVMVSIAGFMSSPFFAVYGAKTAALKIFIESVDVESEKAGSTNRILNVSPGSIKGTSFNSGKTDISQTEELARDIIAHIEKKDDLFIPQYEEVFKGVLQRYHDDFRAEGAHSYDYKINSGRIK